MGKIRLIYSIIAIWAISILAVSCADRDFPQPSAPDINGAIDTESIRLPIRSSYYNVHINLPPEQLSDVKVDIDGDWLELLSDTVSSDGYVEIYAPRNENDFGRTGSLMIGDPDSGGVSIPVYQCGPSDEDNNGGLSIYAGCGYNIFNEINSETSLCSPVIDFGEANRIDPAIVQTVARHLQDTETITSNSLTEMAELVTRSMEKQSSGLIGGKKTVARMENRSGTYRMDDVGYAYINLQRIVACSSLDLSKVLQYAGQGNNDIFTDQFRRQYESIIANPTEEKIFRLFRDFGTHLVTYVDLGGIMDIAVRFNKTMVGELNMRADDFRKYFFNSQPSDFTLNNQIQGLSSSVTDAGTFKIAGGSKSTRDAIIRNCKSQGHINPADIYAWEQTLPKDNFMGSDNLAPINVQLVPIWSLFPQRYANVFFKCALAESKKGPNLIDDAKSGLDNYGISLTDYSNFYDDPEDPSNYDMMRFEDDPGESLVRVLYADQSDIDKAIPILEICNEYIPALKSNERVSIIYPIRNGRTFHGTGLYRGDGHGCGPAWLTFSEGDVYIRPVEGTTSTTVLDSVYYLHGNIYTTSLGLDLKESFVGKWQPKGIMNMPIVKIGSGYWTRQNVRKSIASGENINGEFHIREMTVNRDQPDQQVWVYVRNQINAATAPHGVGSDIDEIYEEPLFWYFPTRRDMENLVEYVGNDTRHLLKGQLSGFDVRFEGFFGPGGIDGVYMNTRQDFHNTDKCYLIFKTDRNSRSGMALCLNSNYRWNTIAIGEGNNNYFPLRLFRSSYYKYSDLYHARDYYH